MSHVIRTPHEESLTKADRGSFMGCTLFENRKLVRFRTAGIVLLDERSQVSVRICMDSIKAF
jgi:hypothetical protein